MRTGDEHLECQPDIVAEIGKGISMLEPEARDELTEVSVIIKNEVAVRWHKQASDHAATCQGMEWPDLLIAQDVIAENVTIEWFTKQFAAV